MSWKRRSSFLKAQAFLEKNDYSAADMAYSDILKDEPEQAEALLHRAYVRLRMGQLDMALIDATRCVELRPESGVMYMALGEILLAQKNYPKAHEVLLKATELEKDNGRALYHLGRASLALSRKEEAAEYFQLAMQFERDYVIGQWMAESLG